MLAQPGNQQYRISQTQMTRDQYTAAQYRLAQQSQNSEKKPSIARRIIVSVLTLKS